MKTNRARIRRTRRTHRTAALLTVALVATVVPFVVASQPAEAARATRTIHLTAGANLELPLYVTSITVQAVGGSGAFGRVKGGGLGGKGGTTWANLAVRPGETLQIVVGNSGTTGFPADPIAQRFAGGAPVTYLLESRKTGAGGSASVVLRDGQPLVVAGGGGGGGNAFCDDQRCVGGKGGDGGGFAGSDAYASGSFLGEGMGGSGTTDTSRGQDAVASKEPSGIFSSTGAESGGGGGGWRGGKAGTIGGVGGGGGGGAGGTSMSVDPSANFGPSGTSGDGWVNITYDAPFLPTNGEIATASNPSQYGDNVLFNLSMAWSASASVGTPGPVGQITFGTKDLKTGLEATLGVRSVAADGSASFALPTTLPVGTTLVWASYPGDDNHSSFKTNYYAQSVVAGKPSFSLSPAVLDFGNQPIGSTTYQTVTLTNTGSATWQAVNGRSDATAFAIQSTDCQSPIAPSASCKLNAKFTPALVGAVSGNITLFDGIGNETVVPMKGAGPAPLMNAVLSPSVLNFGTVPVGTKTTVLVTLTSTGDVPFRLARVATSNGAFNQAATSCEVGVATTSCTFTFSYKASQAGSESGQFTIFDQQDHQYVVDASGTGVVQSTTTMQPTTTTAQPVMNASLNPSVLDFGDVPVGTKTTKVVTLTSTGNVPFRLVWVSTTNAAFNQASTTCDLGTDITTCTFTFSYKASQSGPESGQFTIEDEKQHSYIVTASGTGTVPATTTSTVPATTTTTTAAPPLPPTITGVSPASGRRRGGMTVTITGRNLTSVSAIVFGATPAQQFWCPTPTRCTAVSPPGNATVHIALRSPAGSTQLSPVDQFRYNNREKGDEPRDDGRDGHRGD